MATATLTIKDGIITSHSDRYFVSLSENGKEYCGNGWMVRIKDGRKDRPGRIICHAERIYSDGPAVCHREFRLADGTLGLAGGNIYSRYAYFRSEEFQKFLNRFGITAVKKEDPNQRFSGFSNYSGWGTASQKVWSDGSIEWDYEDAPGSREIFEAPGANPNLYSGTVYHTVSGATWAIVETSEDYRDNHNYAVILYTTVKNVMSLEDSLMSHPKIAKRVLYREQTARLNEFNGRIVHTVDDVKSVVDDIIRIAPKMKSTVDDERVSKFLLETFEQENGYEFRIKARGPMSNSTLGDYEFNIVYSCENRGYADYCRIATGFLGLA